MEEIEDKKLEKQVYSTYRQIASILLTLITIIIFFWKYLVLVPVGIVALLGSLTIFNMSYSLFSISIVLTLAIDVRTLYTYIRYILESFVNKKRVRSIILAIILVGVIALFKTQESFMNETFITLTYTILLVTGATIAPVIRSILDIIKIWKKYKKEKNDGKKSKTKSIILTITVIAVVVVTQLFMGILSYALTTSTIHTIKHYTFKEIFSVKERKISDKELFEENTISNPHISESQRNLNIVFAPSSKLREDWITNIYKYNDRQKGASNYTFRNDINLHSDEKVLSYMKVCFQLDDDLANFIPVEDDEKNYNKIDSYLIASSVMQITLKPGVELENNYYTLRLNRYDEDFNISTDCKYIFEPVAEVSKDSEGRQVIYVNYDTYYPLGELKNIELILGKE